jgi:hypothetical protein
MTQMGGRLQAASSAVGYGWSIDRSRNLKPGIGKGVGEQHGMFVRTGWCDTIRPVLPWKRRQQGRGRLVDSDAPSLSGCRPMVTDEARQERTEG